MPGWRRRAFEMLDSQTDSTSKTTLFSEANVFYHSSSKDFSSFVWLQEILIYSLIRQLLSAYSMPGIVPGARNDKTIEGSFCRAPVVQRQRAKVELQWPKNYPSKDKFL